MTRTYRYVSTVILLALALAGAAIGLFFIDYVAPFHLDRAPNLLTRYHLQVLKRNPERCFAALDRSAVDYRPAPPLRRADGCGYDDAVYLQNSGIRYGSRILLRCSALLGVLLWERHVLIPEAEKHFGRKPVSLSHLGTYSCRNITGKRRGMLSQHASANAIDIAGFRIERGPAITVARNWKDESTNGRFLRDVRDGACRIFSAVLSPDHDRSHGNHFHLDMGDVNACR